eukprot:EG_transcript_20354
MNPDNALASPDDVLLQPTVLSTLCTSSADDFAAADDTVFEEAAALLEAIVQDPEFLEQQEAFLLEHCDEFSFDEENKLVYTDLHNEYIDLVEEHVVSRLQAEVPGFQLDLFMDMLEERSGEVNPEVIETLTRATDFQAFKQAMLATKLEEQELDLELEKSLKRFYLGQRQDLDLEGEAAAAQTSAEGSNASHPSHTSAAAATEAPAAAPPPPRSLTGGPRNLRRIVAEAHSAGSESG